MRKSVSGRAGLAVAAAVAALGAATAAPVPGSGPPGVARVVPVERSKWLAAERLQGSGIAIVGSEIYVVGDRASAQGNTVVVFDRAAFAGRGDSLEPRRRIALDVANPAIADPIKKQYYRSRVCEGGGCEGLDIEDLAVDAAGALYVSLEGRPDAVIKFDPATRRAVDVWGAVTGDEGNLGAEGVAVSPDGGLVFVGRQNPAEVTVINTKTEWTSRGPVDVDQINGLAYDAGGRRLFVLDSSRNEIVALTIDGRVSARFAIDPKAALDPSGAKFLGLRFGAIALDRGGRTVWLVTDPPHDDAHPYEPAAGGRSAAAYEKGYSMLYRGALGR